MISAVVLSSHTTGLGVTRALGEKGVPVTVFYYEKNDMGYVSKYVKEAFYSPHPEDAEEAFIALLLEYGKQKGKSLLIPADDATLLAVSGNKAELARYYHVACTEEEIAIKFLNKKYTYEIAEKIGIPIPETRVPRSVEELESYAEHISYPCLIKPCFSHRYFSHFRRKMAQADNFDMLRSEYLKARVNGFDVLVQELIPGDDTRGANYNSYFWNGTPALEYTAEKVRMSPPGSGVPSVVVGKAIPEIIEPGRKLLKALGYYGYSCTEFKRDPRDGIYKLLEVNGRHNRSTLLAVRSGINFPWIEYRHLTAGELIPEKKQTQTLYWIDEFRDLFESIKHVEMERNGLPNFFKPYLHRHVFAVLDKKDLKPFLKRCFDLFKTVSAKLWINPLPNRP